MKRSIFILTFISLTTISFFCFGGNKENFAKFLDCFKTWQTPFGIDKNMNHMFVEVVCKEDALDPKFVKEFICNANNKDYSDSLFRYAAGIKYQYGGLHVITVNKIYFDPGKSIYTHLLNEFILLVYNDQGDQISQNVFSKTSLGYVSEFYFVNDSTIRAVQATVIDENSIQTVGPKEVWVDCTQYTIHKNGMVNKVEYKPRAKGLIKWNINKPGDDIVVEGNVLSPVG